MTAELTWSDDFVLGLPAMDATHEEFVDLLGQVQTADDAQVIDLWRTLVAHTDDHFGREDGWMKQTRFAASNCHSMQHNVVLQVMREGLKRGEAGDLAMVRQMAHELTIWFPQHAHSMDTALAMHLRAVSFDPDTGIVHQPSALPREEIQGCGGATCSPADSTASAA